MGCFRAEDHYGGKLNHLKDNPEFAQADAALAHEGKREEAMYHYEETLRLLKAMDQLSSER
jgi:hypothetical protein